MGLFGSSKRKTSRAQRVKKLENKIARIEKIRKLKEKEASLRKKLSGMRR